MIKRKFIKSLKKATKPFIKLMKKIEKQYKKENKYYDIVDHYYKTDKEKAYNDSLKKWAEKENKT